ncbi:MAG: hypothetical protein ACRD3D_16245 [Terriglobia bacterium]
MTICLATACDCFNPDTNPKLVLVADQMISTGTSYSLGPKISKIASSWFAMTAGDDVTEAENVLAWARKDIDQLADAPARSVTKAVKEAYRKRRIERIEDIYLRPYSWDMNLFLREGRNALGEAMFERMKYEMDTFSLGFDLLICGFEGLKHKTPAFATVSNPGVVAAKTFPGNYVALGSGAPNATSYLDWRRQAQRTDLSETVYNCIAAKAMSESALGIGKETSVLIVECTEGFPRKLLNPWKIQDIREIWENEEANIRPDNLKERIAAVIDPSADSPNA